MPVALKVGFRETRRMQKWAKYRPFRITKKVATLNFKLDLPPSMKVRTKVFHILLLEPALRKVPLEKKVEVEADEDEFDV